MNETNYNKIHRIKELQTIVIQKLRILGFEDVSEVSLINNVTHNILYKDAIEAELSFIEVLKKDYLEALNNLKEVK